MLVNIHEAKTQLSRLIKLAAKGQEIILARDGKPVARLIGFRAPGRRIPGHAANDGQMAEDFDVPLTEEILSSFEKDF